LPPYSPNLNQIKRLRKFMDERYFASPRVFHEAIYHFFNVTLREKVNKSTCRINNNFQILNPQVN
ncbi:IS630 family transposase, partial [Photorhabdus sp. P32]